MLTNNTTLAISQEEFHNSIPYHTTKRAAKKLGLHPVYLQTLLSHDIIPSVLIGRTRFIPKSYIDNLEKKNSNSAHWDFRKTNKSVEKV